MCDFTASVGHDIVLALFVCCVCFIVSLHARRATAAARLACSFLKEDMGKQSVLCSVLVALYLVHLQTVNAQQQWTIQRNKMDCIGQDGLILPQIGANTEKLWPTSSYLPRGNAIRRMTGGAGLKVNAGEKLPLLVPSAVSALTPAPATAGDQHGRLLDRVLRHLQGTVRTPWGMINSRWTCGRCCLVWCCCSSDRLQLQLRSCTSSLMLYLPADHRK